MEAGEAVQHILEAFGNSVGIERMHGMPVMKVRKDDLPTIAHFIHTTPSLRGTLSMQWAVDMRPFHSAFRVFYLFALTAGDAWLVLETELAGDDRLYHSITPHLHAAKWYEREIRDMFGLIAQGHPDLRRLVRHEHWPKGTHPLKKDFSWDTVLERQQGQYAFRHIEGEGVLEVPVGPIHAGIIEPGHFRFSVV